VKLAVGKLSTARLLDLMNHPHCRMLTDEEVTALGYPDTVKLGAVNSYGIHRDVADQAREEVARRIDEAFKRKD
jgi:hypothetical protein